MDMATYSALFGNADAFFKSIVRECKGGMQTHHGGDLSITVTDFLYEALVFCDSAAHDIAVRDFVAQRSTHASLADGGLDNVKRAIARGWGGMVVDHGGGAVTDTVDQRELG